MGLIRTVEADLLKNPFVPSEDDGADTYEMVCESFDASQPDDVPYVRDEPKIGRNDPCWCGSGKKYKKCHLAADEAR